MSSATSNHNNNNNNKDKNGDNGTTTTSGKVAFSLGGKKKKKKSTSTKATATAADFGHDNNSQEGTHQSSSSLHESQNQTPLVIPLSQPTQSLLTRIKQEDNANNNANSTDPPIKQEDAEAIAALTASSSSTNKNKNNNEASPPVVVSSSNSNNTNRLIHSQQSLQQEGDSSKEQLQRDLEQLPDETNEESYDHVPVSQFGAALLRGMGWSEETDNSQNTKTAAAGETLPRPHRLGLGAIPKAPEDTTNNNMPSVLTGRRNKKIKKMTVQQLQQQEEFERKRQLQLQQDKQRTLQVGSIVYLKQHDNNNDKNSQTPPHRAKIIQLQGVPGLNMVSVQMEQETKPTFIKRGLLGSLVPRPELEQEPFVIPPEPQSSNDRKDTDDRRRRDDKKVERGRDRSSSRDRDSDDRDRKRDRRDSSRKSRDRDRERDDEDRRRKDRDRRRREEEEEDDRRSRDRDRRKDDDDDRRSRDRRKDDGERRSRDRDRKRDHDDRRSRDRDRDRSERNSKRRRDGRGSDDDEEEDRDRKRRKDKRREEEDRSSRKKSKSEKHKSSKDYNNNNPLWIIPNIRVRVVTEKLGKRYFRQKGVVVDVTRTHGATIRVDMVEGSSGGGRGGNGNHVVLEHVPERYLETALPKPGGQAIVLAGPNQWTKGRLLERNSKTGKGSIQVYEDMNIITLSLDDMAEWCGPLDDDLGD